MWLQTLSEFNGLGCSGVIPKMDVIKTLRGAPAHSFNLTEFFDSPRRASLH
jgi:hypothetical protein